MLYPAFRAAHKLFRSESPASASKKSCQEARTCCTLAAQEILVATQLQLTVTRLSTNRTGRISPPSGEFRLEGSYIEANASTSPGVLPRISVATFSGTCDPAPVTPLQPGD